MSNHTDIQQLENLKEDVRGAYKDLYQNYFGMIRHLVLKNSGSEDDASDVFQDSILALYEMIKKPAFKLTSKLSTLLYSIARNQWLKKLKSNQKEVRWTDFERVVELPEENESMELNEQRLEKIDEILNTMGDPCKTILIQFYYFKKKMTEIAEKLNYQNADHAKNQKYKCLQRLKKMATR